MNIDDTFDDQDDITKPLNYRLWRAEVEDVVNAYVLEVENYRAEVKVLRKQLETLARLMGSRA